MSDPKDTNINDQETITLPSTGSSSSRSGSGVLSPGSELIGGRFQILSLIGAGGMGSVYRARDSELGEVVALKMLKWGPVTSPDALERFRQEVRLARRVTHRNVARTYDIGEHRD